MDGCYDQKCLWISPLFSNWRELEVTQVPIYFVSCQAESSLNSIMFIDQFRQTDLTAGYSASDTDSNPILQIQKCKVSSRCILLQRACVGLRN